MTYTEVRFSCWYTHPHDVLDWDGNLVGKTIEIPVFCLANKVIYGDCTRLDSIYM